jgi:hypothetical protein
VTTGDGLASHILHGMKTIQPNTNIILEVFKVPHHGSEKNNHFLFDYFPFHKKSVCDDVRKKILDAIPTTNGYQRDEHWIAHVKDLGREFYEMQLSKLHFVHNDVRYNLDTVTDIGYVTLLLAERYQGIIAGNDVKDIIGGIRYESGVQWDFQKIMRETEDKAFYENVENDAVFIGTLRVAYRVKDFYTTFR